MILAPNGGGVLPKFPLRGGDAPRQTVRRFTDAAGVEWSVYDVVNATTEGGIPGTFLCFERGVDRRRLAPIPADWKECEPAKLDSYLKSAKAVHRSFASPDQFRERRR
jgi:hypothetical protein